jgi:flavin reductase (DIM6/NTAB) family NADH-FMN oxidoreductase RutF
MSKFKQIIPEDFKGNPFTMIGADCMLICAGKKGGSVNAMTAAWGGLGVMWGKDVAFAVIRPQRFTKEFVDESNTLSLTFFDKGHERMMSYMGSVSGRDEDKIKKMGLTVIKDGGTPYFEEAQTVLICKKLYAQDMKADCFTVREPDEKWYPAKDYHTLYIAEIEKILIKE